MFLALLGAVIPRVVGLFTHKTDDKSQMEVQGLKTIGGALKYHGIRILVIVVVSAITAIWTAEQMEQLIDGWKNWHSHTLHFFGSAMLSGLLGRL